ncbi:MAG: F0F1 ATP synthase subunit alpha [Erysipelotrichaceae bacterium]|nr:F0F1 ATP synthase subunit alpha [Erysipelotrichaceae bacterium]
MSFNISIYAGNLMELVSQEDLIDTCYRDLKDINNALNRDEELLKYITSAEYTSSQKKKKLQEVFANELDETVLYGLFLVIESMPRKHMEYELIHAFLAYYYRSRGIEFGCAYSAREIDKRDLMTLEAAFSQKLSRTIRLENKIDKKLIGGVKVVINGSVWDGTYKSRMDELKDTLLNKEIETDNADLGLDLNKEIANFNLTQIKTESELTTGQVTSVADGVANISGIYNAMAGEILNVGGTKAMVMDLEENNIAAVLLGNDKDIVKGTEVSSTGKVIEVPVGDELLGRVVDALGRPIDGKGVIKTAHTRQIEVSAPGIIDRSPVNEPLQTGIKIIDSMIPIGKGQRELIIGDRQTGKTALAIDTIINQKGRNVKCIYVAIGQKNSTVAQIIEKLNNYGSMAYTTVVVAGASELASLQYIAPYSGCSIGEYWMNKGEDVLIVYDDLSKHAVAYRTLSLLLRRPPGREAYPGDVFYLHSRLLERSGKLSERLGKGSLTALPIIETQAGDISAYIPTNVISITDGQIFLQTEMFNSGIRPAIDYGLSVSRVGSAAQIKAMKQVSSSLKLDLSQYQEVLDFAQFGSDLDPSTRARINHGRHLVEMLKQPQYQPMATTDQIILLLASRLGVLDDIPLEEIKEYEKDLLIEMNSVHRDLIKEIEEKKVIDDELNEKLSSIITVFTTQFRLMDN